MFLASIDSNLSEHEVWIENLSPDTNYHEYEIVHATSTNYWDFALDYNYTAHSDDMNSWTGYDHRVGMEVQSQYFGAGVYAAPSFNQYGQYEASNGSWNYWPGQSQQVTYPCNNPNYPHPYCSDFFSYHPYELSWQKSDS